MIVVLNNRMYDNAKSHKRYITESSHYGKAIHFQEYIAAVPIATSRSILKSIKCESQFVPYQKPVTGWLNKTIIHSLHLLRISSSPSWNKYTKHRKCILGADTASHYFSRYLLQSQCGRPGLVLQENGQHLA